MRSGEANKNESLQSRFRSLDVKKITTSVIRHDLTWVCLGLSSNHLKLKCYINNYKVDVFKTYLEASHTFFSFVDKVSIIKGV